MSCSNLISLRSCNMFFRSVSFEFHDIVIWVFLIVFFLKSFKWIDHKIVFCSVKESIARLQFCGFKIFKYSICCILSIFSRVTNKPFGIFKSDIKYVFKISFTKYTKKRILHVMIIRSYLLVNTGRLVYKNHLTSYKHILIRDDKSSHKFQ